MSEVNLINISEVKKSSEELYNHTNHVALPATIPSYFNDIGIDTLHLYIDPDYVKVGDNHKFSLSFNDIHPEDSDINQFEFNTPLFITNESNIPIECKYSYFNSENYSLDYTRKGVFIKIHSIPKCINENNIWPISIDETFEAICSVSADMMKNYSISADFHHATVCRCDLFTTLSTSADYNTFLPLFEIINPSTKNMVKINEQYDSSVTWKNKSMEFTVYDKKKQMLDTKQKFEESQFPKNVYLIRFECRYKGTRKVNRSFLGKGLFYLLSKKNYLKLQNEFILWVNKNVFIWNNFNESMIDLSRYELMCQLKEYFENKKSEDRFFADLGRQVFLNRLGNISEFNKLFEITFDKSSTNRSKKSRIKGNLKQALPSSLNNSEELFRQYEYLRKKFNALCMV